VNNFITEYRIKNTSGADWKPVPLSSWLYKKAVTGNIKAAGYLSKTMLS
jgi:hypothetical protein